MNGYECQADQIIQRTSAPFRSRAGEARFAQRAQQSLAHVVELSCTLDQRPRLLGQIAVARRAVGQQVRGRRPTPKCVTLRLDRPERGDAKRAELGKGPGPSATRCELTFACPDSACDGCSQVGDCRWCVGRRVQRANVGLNERSAAGRDVTCVLLHICGSTISDAHDTTGFELESGQAAGRHHLTRHAQVQAVVQALADLPRKRGMGP